LSSLRRIPRLHRRSGTGRWRGATCFGDEAGRKVNDVKRAWQTATLRAHGYTAKWTKGRHECGSRLLEAGWPLHHVKDMLGHASVSQTDTYLNASKIGLADSMRRHDAKVARCKPVASEPAIEPPPARPDVSVVEGNSPID